MARLGDLLIQQYNQDFPELSYEEKDEHSFEDKRFLQIMKESLRKIDDHYEIRLPFRKDDLCMPNNRQMA